MKSRVVAYGALGMAVAMLVACTAPNSLLSDLQTKVDGGNGTTGNGTTGNGTPNGAVSTPLFSPTTGVYSANQLVTIQETEAGATIHYTSGSSPLDPTAASAVYAGPIPVSGNGTIMTIKAIATKSAMANSSIVTATYTINYSQVSTPQISPFTGSYGGPETVTIFDSTGGASIAYTTDGSTPTESGGVITHGNPYSGPFNVTSTEEVKAIAYKVGLADSTVPFANYTLPDSAPAFSPGAGTYPNAQSVTINTTMPGASIAYTTDGSTPTESGGVITHGTLYSGPVNIGTSQTLQAIAYKSGWADSTPATAAYTITTYTVTYDPNGANHGSPPTDSNNYHQGDTVTVLNNTGGLKKGPHSFLDWSTASGSGGTTYQGGNTFSMGTANVTLYAHYQ
jgi:hypothetical protein